MHVIEVAFDMNKSKNFPEYRERWLGMIDENFGSNVKYNLTIDGAKYIYISFESLKFLINEL